MTRTRRAVIVLVALALAAAGYLVTQASPPICVGLSCGDYMELTR